MPSKNQRRGDPRPWLPMAPAVQIPHTPEKVAELRQMTIDRGVPEDQIDAVMDDLLKPQEVWRNHHYIVHVDRRPSDNTVAELSIRRADRKPLRDWRDFQRIKNEIAGPDAEAVELYPAQDRIVDTANQYFLWCMPPGERFPFGFSTGMLANATGGTGAVQRELPSDWTEGKEVDH